MSYYKFTYDPSEIIKTVDKNQKYGAEYLKKLKEIFNFTKRENCCNCISISLYLKNPLDALKYLMGLRN